MIASGVTTANVVIPTRWFFTRSFEFFLLAGLMIRFQPTTLKRGYLVSLNFQGLTTAVFVLIVLMANLSEMLG